MDVEVDLYSGRPNPHFALGPVESGEVMRRIGALPPAADSKQPRDGLGYRGLHIRAGSDDTATGIVVSDGLVVIRDPDGSLRRLRDPGRTLERWTIDVGVTNLDPEAVATIRHELAR
jgi:hypothetical protein